MHSSYFNRATILITTLILTGAFIACGGAPAYNSKDAKSIIANVNHEVGGLKKLKALKDVQFTYDYNQVSENVKDVSVEKYIFAGEFSRGDYSVHEKHVAPGMEGPVVQVLNQGKPAISVNGEKKDDPQLLGGTAFLRAANYFWFTMFFKITDQGTVLKLLEPKTVNGTRYDVVQVSYDPAVTGKEVNDTYILFVNPQTKRVDQFLFSLPAMQINDPVLLFEVEYKEMNGITIASKRTMYGTKDGEKATPALLIQTISDVKFNNGFTAADLSI